MINNRGFNIVFTDKMLHPVATAVVLTLFAASCCYTVLHSLNWPLVLDPPLMHYTAWRILSGDIPYKDIFDMNMPGTYLIHMFVIKVFGSSDFGWRVFDILWLSLTVLATTLFCYPCGRWAAVFASLFFAAFHLGNGPFALGQRDFLICPFLMFAALFFSKCLERNNQLWYLFCSGMLLGCAIIIKPPVLLLGILFLLIYIYNRYSRKEWIWGSLVLTGSMLIVPLVVLFWLLSKGAFVPFWHILTGYLPLYAALQRLDYMDMVLLKMLKDHKIAIVILIGVLFFIRRKSLSNVRLVILIMGIFYGVVHLFSQGKGFIYHRYPFYLFLFPLAAIALDDLLNRRQNYFKAVAIACLGLLVILSGYRCYESVTGRSYLASKKKHSVDKLIQDISAYALSEEDTVQMLDTANGGINALYRLRLRQPTRFIYDFQFLHDIDEPFIRSLRSEFINDLTMNKPKLIVVFHWSWLPPHSLERITSFPEFQALLEEKYTSNNSGDRYTIYVAK